VRQMTRKSGRRTKSSRPRKWISAPTDHAATLREIFEANLMLRGIVRATPVPAPARKRAA